MPIRESETFIREQSGNFFSDKSGNPVIVLDGYFPFIKSLHRGCLSFPILTNSGFCVKWIDILFWCGDIKKIAAIAYIGLYALYTIQVKCYFTLRLNVIDLFP